MTGDVVNLRHVRKQKARSEKEKRAEQNRISFGRTKAETSLTRALNEKADRRLEDGRIERTNRSFEHDAVDARETGDDA
jgi:hypothetical protein